MNAVDTVARLWYEKKKEKNLNLSSSDMKRSGWKVQKGTGWDDGKVSRRKRKWIKVKKAQASCFNMCILKGNWEQCGGQLMCQCLERWCSLLCRDRKWLWKALCHIGYPCLNSVFIFSYKCRRHSSLLCTFLGADVHHFCFYFATKLIHNLWTCVMREMLNLMTKKKTASFIFRSFFLNNFFF